MAVICLFSLCSSSADDAAGFYSLLKVLEIWLVVIMYEAFPQSSVFGRTCKEPAMRDTGTSMTFYPKRRNLTS